MNAVIEDEKIFSLWLEVFASYEIPNDVKHYIVTHFYCPFVQAQKERIRISALSDYLKPNPGLEELTGYYIALVQLLGDKTIQLDTRIKDGRIMEYVSMISARRQSISTLHHLYLPVLNKGLMIDNFLAFGLLWELKKLDECEETLPFVKRAFKFLNNLSHWDSLNKRYVRLIADYCLEKEIYKPVWKWLSIWPWKIGSSGWLFPREPMSSTELQLSKLYEKFKEPYKYRFADDTGKRKNTMIVSIK